MENDHDILIEVRTTLNMLVETQREYLTQYGKLAERVATIETKDSRDSERLRAISVDVQRSLDNHTRINTLETQITEIKENVSTMQRRSNMLDGLNGLGVAISTVIGFIFGHK